MRRRPRKVGNSAGRRRGFLGRVGRGAIESRHARHLPKRRLLRLGVDARQFGGLGVGDVFVFFLVVKVVVVVVAAVVSRLGAGRRVVVRVRGRRLRVHLFRLVAARALEPNPIEGAPERRVPKLPDVDNEVVGGVSAGKAGKAMLGVQGRDHEPVLEDQRSASLFDGNDFVKAHDQRRRPAKDVAAEAKMTLGDVEPAVGKNLALQGAAVVLDEIVVVGHALEEGVEVAVPPLTSNGKSRELRGPETGAGVHHRAVGGCNGRSDRRPRASRRGRASSLSVRPHGTPDARGPLDGGFGVQLGGWRRLIAGRRLHQGARPA
ncbi:hypothetical protein G6O67_000944 [Ophiocordyceps sinensis]|uniref:Uncharacterized protein n=1 Tax=Ophiocordyceps sinensis TaxID=72228 RepID=A0A8H4V9Q4_9HYPO|nr:hypothetical protein G6O67_000438 [Ophiocordyceps sinensis]KAF4513703.1 hypothetical protein G6O67_000944 [Ophiocordyceps sinensis]